MVDWGTSGAVVSSLRKRSGSRRRWPAAAAKLNTEKMDKSRTQSEAAWTVSHVTSGNLHLGRLLAFKLQIALLHFAGLTSPKETLC